jgi:hypothetical protein
MRTQIFREIAPPKKQDALPINAFASWHTWSEEFNSFLSEAKNDLDRLSAPQLICIRQLRKYNKTFSWPADAWSTRQRARRFERFARALPNASNKVMFFHGLLKPGLTSQQLHALFAVLRGTLASLSGNDILALYTPLGDVGDHVGAFPLHADLYIPKNLFNVFDDVPKDNSGASIFLPVHTFSALLPSVRSLPEGIAKKIVSLVCDDLGKDGFNALFDLLYGEHPWASDLQHILERHQFRIKLASGQGYLLNDRFWLHGREAAYGGVSNNRVHRLVYEAIRVSKGARLGADVAKAL